MIGEYGPLSRRIYELIYQDNTRKHINSSERNSLLLSREIKQIGPTRYKFIGQPKTFHAFADLQQLISLMAVAPNLLRHYLNALCVIFEIHLERERQLEETPEAFALRLEEMGCQRVQHQEVQCKPNS